MCRLIGKDKSVTAGLGVFAREEFYKFETICILDLQIVPATDTSSINVLTMPDGRKVYTQGPSTAYAGYINDPKNEALENCEVVFDPLLGRYILRATTDIEAQHEILMRYQDSLFTNEIPLGLELVQKIWYVEERELAKAAEKAATKLEYELKKQMKPRSYHQKLDEKTKRETRAMTVREL
jgi:hypothetical protein